VSASIKSIFVEDFQSHAKTKIELPGPGQLCVIVGPTDSGKTAIVRGLRLLMYNVPQGTDYIRVGRSTATVAVEMSDGTKVARERSKSVNRYRIVKPGLSPQMFEGFGLAVPLEVQEATGVRTVSIGENLDLALNLSEQLDGPFLGKSVSGPAKAKILGALAGTEEVDEAQRAVQLDLHRAGQEERRIADETRLLDAKIAEYDYLPALAERISALETILASVKEAQTRLSALESAKGKLDSINAQRAQALAILARWGGLTEAVSHVEYAEGALTKMQALSGHKASLASIAAQRAEWSRRLARWAGLEEAASFYDEAEKASSRLAKLEELSDDLDSTTNGIEMCRFAVERWAGLDAAEARVAACSEALHKLDRLYSLSTVLGAIEADKAMHSRILQRLTVLEDAEAIVARIPELTQCLTTLEQHAEALYRIRQARVVAENDLDRHTKALNDAQASYVEVLIQLGTCPLCGSQVSPESIKSHVKEVA
jgi:exonuclease SbcC